MTGKLGGLDVMPVQDVESYFNLLVYGSPGVGKTVLAGSAAAVPEMSPVLVVDIEGGTMSLRGTFPDVDTVRVTSWRDMQKINTALRKGEGGYKTVVLDSLTEIQKFSMLEIMKQVIKEDPDRDPEVPSIREWGKNGEQVRRIVRMYRDLPMNVIFTALVISDKDERTNKPTHRVSLTGKLGEEIPGFVDIVAYYYMVDKDDVQKRFLLTRKTDRVVAKDRTNMLTPTIEEPTMDKIHKLIYPNKQENK